MSDIETIKAEVKKLNMRAVKSKMDLHDLSEELPADWERIMEVAKACYDAHAALAAAKKKLKEVGG